MSLVVVAAMRLPAATMPSATPIKRNRTVRPRPGTPSPVLTYPACAGGCLTTPKMMNTMRTTTMMATGLHSDSRCHTVFDSVCHGGFAIPAQVSGIPKTRPTNSQTP